MVTSLDTLKSKAVQEVKLPGWDNEPFVCKLKRVSVFDLASRGKIPNPLLGTVIDMFEKKAKVEKPEDMTNMFEVINIFCKEAMVEPTYEEVENIVSLTDDQRLAIYDYAQDGVRRLIPSPKNPSDLLNNKSKQKI